MRNIVALSLWIASSTVFAQPNWAWGCRSYEPSTIELNELIQKAGAQLHPAAEFQSACFTETPKLVGFTDVRMSKTIRYRFLWPSKKSTRELYLMDESHCSMPDGGEPRCEIQSYLVLQRTSKETIYLYNIENMYDLNELFKFYDRFMANQLKIETIHEHFPRNTDGRVYILEGYSDSPTRTVYHVERHCRGAIECDWTLSGPGYIQY